MQSYNCIINAKPPNAAPIALVGRAIQAAPELELLPAVADEAMAAVLMEEVGVGWPVVYGASLTELAPEKAGVPADVPLAAAVLFGLRTSSIT